PERFFQRDLVEGVGRELDALGDDVAAVRLDLDADVEVHHPLVTDQDLHRWACPRGCKGGMPRPGAAAGPAILPVWAGAFLSAPPPGRRCRSASHARPDWRHGPWSPSRM